jgi:hypothetical protein
MRREIIGMVCGTALAVAFSGGRASADEPKLEGTWTWQRFVEGRRGDATFTLKIQRRGQMLTGQIDGPHGVAPIRDLKIGKNGTATWAADMTVQGKKTTYEYSGSVAGDIMRLQETKKDPETLSSITQYLSARRRP